MSTFDFSPLYRTVVGFDRLASMIDTAARLDGAQGYPPYGEVMKSVTLPSFMVVIQRINLGLYALFGELRAVDLRQQLTDGLAQGQR